MEVNKHAPALICSKCQIDLASAAKFKKISLVADAFFQKLLAPHEEKLFGSDYKLDTSEPEPVEQFTLHTNEEEVEIEVLEEYLDDIIEYDEIEVENDVKNNEIHDEEIIVTEVKDEEFRVAVESANRKERQQLETRKKKPGTNKTIHECYCGMKFASAHRLNNHVKVRHTEVPDDQKLTCLTCGKKFKIQDYLELHIR